MYLNPRLRRFLALGLAFMLLVPPPVHAQEIYLPAPGVRVSLSPAFNPPVLKGLKVHPDNPFRFDFILDKGDGLSSPNASVGDPEFRQESTKLIKYFLASLTVPEKDLWVNLSPYEKDRIVPTSFGQTQMGRDLLAQDYLLKQITASLIYPEDAFGKTFWNRIYQEASKRYGTTNIPVNTFNKVWIVPEKAVVYENAKAGTAYVVESRLKVMLEEDYVALQRSATSRGHSRGISTEDLSAPMAHRDDAHAMASDIVRQVVLPVLEKEINQGRHFAQLRQVYNSLILATWYKKKIKDSILNQVYSDRNKVSGIGYDTPTRGHVAGTASASNVSPSTLPTSQALNMRAPQGNPPNDVEGIYQQYLQAFKKGVYNYIKEDLDPVTQQIIPRKYFSGGFGFTSIDSAMTVTRDTAMLPQVASDHAAIVQTNLNLADQAMAKTEDSAQLAGGQAMINDAEMNHDAFRRFITRMRQGAIIEIHDYEPQEPETKEASQLRSLIESMPLSTRVRSFRSKNQILDILDKSGINQNDATSQWLIYGGLLDNCIMRTIQEIMYGDNNEFRQEKRILADGSFHSIVIPLFASNHTYSRMPESALRYEQKDQLPELLAKHSTIGQIDSGEQDSRLYGGKMRYFNLSYRFFNKIIIRKDGKVLRTLEPKYNSTASKTFVLDFYTNFKDMLTYGFQGNVQMALKFDQEPQPLANPQISPEDRAMVSFRESKAFFQLSEFFRDREILDGWTMTIEGVAAGIGKSSLAEMIKVNGLGRFKPEEIGIIMTDKHITQFSILEGPVLNFRELDKVYQEFLSKYKFIIFEGLYAMDFLKHVKPSFEKNVRILLTAQDGTVRKRILQRDYNLRKIFESQTLFDSMQQEYKTVPIDMRLEYDEIIYHLKPFKLTIDDKVRFVIPELYGDFVHQIVYRVTSMDEFSFLNQKIQEEAHAAGLSDDITGAYAYGMNHVEMILGGTFSLLSQVLKVDRNAIIKIRRYQKGLEIIIEGKNEHFLKILDQRYAIAFLAANSRNLFARSWKGRFDKNWRPVSGVRYVIAQPQRYPKEGSLKINTFGPDIQNKNGDHVFNDPTRRSGDLAMLNSENTGGIDLTPANMNIQVKTGSPTKAFGDDNEGIKFHLDPAMLEQLQNAPGFVPVIINIQPMNDLRLFLGIKDGDPSLRSG